MRVDDTTVRAAFQQHFHRYVNGRTAWDIDHHVKMWEAAARAFRESSFASFDYVYQGLRSYWQVFRGGGSHWSNQQVFDVLVRSDPQLAQSRLSRIRKQDLPRIWAQIQSVKDIKINRTGPSVVAVSKFLHFWNPRLFVIVDDALVWKWVFAHAWLGEQIERVRVETDMLLSGCAIAHDDTVCDLPTYIAVLAWASQLIQENPCIVTEFDKYIRRVAKVTVSHETAEYEAVAVEWFLLGLVAMPPAGVSIGASGA